MRERPFRDDLRDRAIAIDPAILQEIATELRNPKCRKCGGLMIREYRQRSFGEGAVEWGALEGVRRCVSCGAGIDPLILKNRIDPPSVPNPKKTKMRGRDGYFVPNLKRTKR